MITYEKAKNLGGMLVIAVLAYITAGLISYSDLINTVLPFSFNSTWLEISDSTLKTYNPQWVRFVYINSASIIAVLVLTLIMAVFFFKRSRLFPKVLLIYFMLRVLILTYIFYLQTVTIGPPTPTLGEISTTFIRVMLTGGLWIPYIMLSENASETFIY